MRCIILRGGSEGDSIPSGVVVFLEAATRSKSAGTGPRRKTTQNSLRNLLNLGGRGRTGLLGPPPGGRFYLFLFVFVFAFFFGYLFYFGGLGLFLGIIAVYLQESLGIIHLSGTQIPYPVSLNAFNLFVVFGWVLFIGAVGSGISLLSLRKVKL